ncbi:hypothetical protein [Bradyrhizobium sp. Ec3.3]|uniref:hypothetical protein n=1 Tax=Bradyrhizobium sp. Ec3.3 TaxID=189753 RepID=UPI000401E193|nr:hypothetical protein [Bradyrhizobium sp. Ec3.3]
MSNAYARFFVPETPNSPLTSSSYLRLGAYSVGEEEIVTDLISTSDNNSTKHESDHAGILAFTQKDFQVTAEGASLMRIGRGHTTEVRNGDARYKVLNGAYEISAQNDVSISAGADGTAGNISLTASHYEQTTKGDVSETTHGNSKRTTNGSAMEIYNDARVTCVQGANVTTAVGLSVAAFLGGAISIGAGYNLSISCGGNCSIRYFFANALTIDNEFNKVTGNMTRIIGGYNVQVADSDIRYVKKTYLKVVDDADVKRVKLDGTWCETRVQVADAQVQIGQMSSDQHQVVDRVCEVESATGRYNTQNWRTLLYL